MILLFRLIKNLTKELSEDVINPLRCTKNKIMKYNVIIPIQFQYNTDLQKDRPRKLLRNNITK